MVWRVERLGTEFQRLFFSDAECSSQADVHADAAGIAVIYTVRPGVVPLDRHALNATALDGKHHRVIAAGSSVVDNAHAAVILALHRILQVEHTPLIRVAGRRAR